MMIYVLTYIYIYILSCTVYNIRVIPSPSTSLELLQRRPKPRGVALSDRPVSFNVETMGKPMGKRENHRKTMGKRRFTW